jgi:hypothetical protein
MYYPSHIYSSTIWPIWPILKNPSDIKALHGPDDGPDDGPDAIDLAHCKQTGFCEPALGGAAGAMPPFTAGAGARSRSERRAGPDRAHAV